MLEGKEKIDAFPFKTYVFLLFYNLPQPVITIFLNNLTQRSLSESTCALDKVVIYYNNINQQCFRKVVIYYNTQGNLLLIKL